MFDVTACRVERATSQDYQLRWLSHRPFERVDIYMSDDPDYFYRPGYRGDPILSTSQHEVHIDNPEKGVRHYFYLESACGERLVLAERQLSLQGTPNFRDLGGYTTGCGRRLKWGKLYRSSKLSDLTEEDQGYVHRLGLTLICDFRQLMEQELEPTVLHPESQHEVASLPITPGSRFNFMDSLHKGVIQVDDAHGFMQQINRDFVANQMPQYAEMFQLLLTEDKPVLIHCASGKDRTGFGSALILDILGVDEEAIVEDYLLTNRYLPIDEEIERLAGEFTDETGKPLSEKTLRPMVEVRPEYIRACFEEIRKHYESKDHFYQTALNLDSQEIASLKRRYLDDAG
jgi:protein-tyrosine phosphatase